jgi:hypothetical protein
MSIALRGLKPNRYTEWWKTRNQVIQKRVIIHVGAKNIRATRNLDFKDFVMR